MLMALFFWGTKLAMMQAVGTAAMNTAMSAMYHEGFFIRWGRAAKIAKTLVAVFTKIYFGYFAGVSTWFEPLCNHSEVAHAPPWCFETVEREPKS